MYTQDYIHESSESTDSSEIILEYHHESGSNRVWAKFKFKDGFEINLNAVCKGEYSWCIRVNENNEVKEFGSLKMEFDDSTVFIETRVDSINNYRRYLDLLPGKYKKVK
jgi:hypothetical protein